MGFSASHGIVQAKINANGTVVLLERDNPVVCKGQGILLKQKYFKITGTVLRILHIESIKTGFYQIGGVLLFGFIFVKYIELPCLNHGRVYHFFYGNLIFDFLFVFIWFLLPILLILLAQRFPSAPTVTFNSETQKAYWLCAKNKLELPFDKITFEKKLFMPKNGMSSNAVIVSAISKTPFSNADKPLEHEDQVRTNLFEH